MDRWFVAMTLDEIVILVERARNGDRAAYGELFRRFQPTVYALALSRLRNPAEAQELTQEVFVHGMTKIGQVRDPACFPGWLRQITVHMALNRLTRRRPVYSGEGGVLDNTEAAAPTPLDQMVRAEAHDELRQGLDRLRPTDRATLVAFYLRGQSLKQMSREQEAPIGTIKRRLHVARQRLRRELEKDRPAEDRQSPRPRQRELVLT